MDIHVLGDVTIDNFIFIDHNDAVLNCRLNTDNCTLSVKYGEKTPVKELYHSIGGNAANVAVGLTRCGLSNKLYTEVGADVAGQQLIDTLKKEGVNVSQVEVVSKRATNQSYIILYLGERTIFSYHEPDQKLAINIKDSDTVYLTSLGKGWQEVYESVLNSKLLIYQPGTIQIRAGWRQSKAILAKSGILILNYTEAESLLGKTYSNGKDLLNALLNTGAKEVVVTKGKAGSLAANQYEFYEAGVWHEAIKKESTGSGDAYTSAYVASRLKGLGIDVAMQAGTLNAGYVMQEIGAQAGLQRWDELMKAVKSSKITVKNIND
ncbi:MAG: carbohydrate kinase family protein [bacterium]|nr:carbohydrate kinase family protein [bacterium]